MVDSTQIGVLRRQLFTDEHASCYAILDGASVPELLPQLYEHEPEHTCLFAGQLDPELAQTAPYLVLLEPDGAFTDWVLEEGWGNHWGIYATASADIVFIQMRKHFRTFLRVRDPDGKPLYFRYYDPRVLRVYLPTCNADEARTIFGPVTRYIMEGDTPEALLRFGFDGTEVNQNPVPLSPAAGA